MKCPVCVETDLTMSERAGIEIDYCPKCRGVWLDRGELDKIIARSDGPDNYPRRDDDDDDDDDDYKRRRYQQAPPPPHQGYGAPPPPPPQKYYKKKSFWHELFD